MGPDPETLKVLAILDAGEFVPIVPSIEACQGASLETLREVAFYLRGRRHFPGLSERAEQCLEVVEAELTHRTAKEAPMEELIITTKDAVEKIRSAGTDEHQRAYFGLLANRLANSPEIVPKRVIMALTLLEADLARGIDGFTRGPMPDKLTGLPKIMFPMMTRLAIVRMGEFFPPEFAKTVKQEWDAATGATP